MIDRRNYLSAEGMMQELLLSPDLFEKAKSGQKTATIRLGRRDIQLGDLVLRSNADPEKFITRTVRRVTYLAIRELTRQEVNILGYSSFMAMSKRFQEIYPDNESGGETEVTLIEWSHKDDAKG